MFFSLDPSNTKDIREDIKRRINMVNACYYPLEKILSSFPVETTEMGRTRSTNGTIQKCIQSFSGEI